MPFAITAALALIKGVLATGWAWLLPVVGPLLLKARPWLGVVPGLGSIWASVRFVSYVAALGLGVWGGVKVHSWWTGEMVTQQEADARVRAGIRDALGRARDAAVERETAARRDALDQREKALAERERIVADMAAQQDQYERDLDGDRNASTQGDDVAVLGADDSWLRSWQRRGR